MTLLCALPMTSAAQNNEAQAARIASEGQQAMVRGDYATAEHDFESLAKLDPGVAEVHATLAAICFKQREFDRAIQEIHIAQRLKPGLPRLNSLLGVSLAEKGRFTEALPYLEKGFRDPRDPAVQRMCGLELLRAESQLGKDAEAVETALQLNRLYPNDPEVLYHTGRVYGSYAWETMEKLHDTAPNSVWMLQAQGEANESAKNWDAAIAAFERVIALDPRRPGIHYDLGRVYLGRYRETQSAADKQAAMREFNAELKTDPGNGNAAYEIGNIEQESGDLDAAGKQFAEVLKRYPDFEEALVGLGGIDLAARKPAEAVGLLEHAAQLRPDDEVAWWRLSQAEREVGNQAGQKKALAMFQKLRRAPTASSQLPGSSDAVTPQKLDGSAGQQ